MIHISKYRDGRVNILVNSIPFLLFCYYITIFSLFYYYYNKINIFITYIYFSTYIYFYYLLFLILMMAILITDMRMKIIEIIYHFISFCILFGYNFSVISSCSFFLILFSFLM